MLNRLAPIVALLALVMFSGCFDDNTSAPVASVPHPGDQFESFLGFESNTVGNPEGEYVELPGGVQFPPNPPQNQGAICCPFIKAEGGDTVSVTVKLESYYGDADAWGQDFYFEGMSYIDHVFSFATFDNWTAVDGAVNATPFTIGGVVYPAGSISRAGGFTVGPPWAGALSPEGETVNLYQVYFLDVAGDNYIECLQNIDDFASVEAGCSAP